jgi:aspartate racemase
LSQFRPLHLRQRNDNEEKISGESIVKKVIGILGGISPESTLVYYDRIVKTYYERHGDYYYPEILIFSLDFQRFTDFEDGRDRDGYVRYIMRGIEGLQSGGADFIIMAANSPHAVYEEVQRLARIPLLSIVEITAKFAHSQGLRTLLLMGIKFTMQATFYQAVGEKHGLKVIVPGNDDQDEINRIIFEELTIGVFTEESKQKLLRIGANYVVDGIILGCTELPLILKQSDTPVPLLDTVELHIKAALQYALTQS